jgi:hypothetical protein
MGIESVLDECLNQIAAGKEQALDACVAEHLTVARELEPLLRLAVELDTLRQDEPPSPAGLQAGKQKLLREAARLKALEEEKARARHLPSWPINLQSLLRRSTAVVALAAVLVVALLGGGTIAASATSLPGDSLYAVKRMTEEFQLVFTLDRQAKAQLVQKLDERRREEAKAIATSHRVAEMSFRGRLESVGASSWTVGGVQVSISAETVVEGEASTGALVRVEVRSLSDGTLSAVRISAEPPEAAPQPTLSPTPEPTATAVPTQVPPTAVPTTSVPTKVESRPTVVPVEVLPTLTPSRMPTRTATRTPTVTPIPPTPPPPREIKVRFKGTIDAMSAQTWTVDGQTVRIDADTRIDESAGQATVGGTATVLAVRQEDGSLLAIEIQVAPPPTPEQPFEFQGLIESWSATQWVVSGHVLIINGDTAIQGSPQKGLLAEVKALRQSDGSLLAKSIVVQLPTEEVQFEGVIQSISAGQWVVEGVTVRIDAQTQIGGTPAVGAVAEVQGLLLPDGTVLGRRIEVQSALETPSTPPEPTPTEATPAAELPQGERDRTDG